MEYNYMIIHLKENKEQRIYTEKVDTDRFSAALYKKEVISVRDLASKIIYIFRPEEILYVEVVEVNE